MAAMTSDSGATGTVTHVCAGALPSTFQRKGRILQGFTRPLLGSTRKASLWDTLCLR
jgi:hypothetical protein